MRLMRLGNAGEERPAAYAGGRLLDIGGVVGDITPDKLTSGALHADMAAAGGDLPELEPGADRVGPPLARIGKIVCVGLNYRLHAEEAGLPIPEEPILFLKAPDTVVGAYDNVLIPPASRKTDYEVELAVVIGRTARRLPDEASAREAVAGYAMSNDVSEREWQLERGGQWDKGKNAETFNPLGPWLVTADEVPDPQQLRLTLSVNGELRQDSTTADMIFPVVHLVRYVSHFMTLYPGDVINTGTPSGVGAGFEPPRFLDHGDVVDLAIEGLGRQRQSFRRVPEDPR